MGLYLGDLEEVELHGGFTTEDADENGDFALCVVYGGDGTE